MHKWEIKSSISSKNQAHSATWICSIFDDVFLLHAIRGNSFGRRGWAAVANSLESSLHLSTINSISCRGMFSGALASLDLKAQGNDFISSIVPSLPRSSAKLQSLDLRWHSTHVHLVQAVISHTRCPLITLVQALRIDIAWNVPLYQIFVALSNNSPFFLLSSNELGNDCVDLFVVLPYLTVLQMLDLT